MGGQCCSGDQGKSTTDSLAPGMQTQTRQQRKLESATRANQAQEDMLSKASFSTDTSRERSDTYAEYDRTASRSSSFARNLMIEIPADTTSDRNPNFKTPVDVGLPQPDMIIDEEVDDTESEMMVMQPSDSLSSMGSQMVRMDSNQQLSQASSFQNMHEMNRDASGANLNAAGSTTQFVNVEEQDEESDDESVMERCDDDDVSDATSAMIRADASEATSIMRGDDATSQSESVMERIEAESSSSVSAPQPIEAAQVPKELRQLGRMQGSVANLAVAANLGHQSLETQVRSTSNMATINQL